MKAVPGKLSKALQAEIGGTLPKTPRIIVNATNMGRYLDGIGVYTLNLLKELSRLDTNLEFTVYMNRSGRVHVRNITFPKRCEVRWVTSLISPDHKFPGHLLRLVYSNYLAFKHRKSLTFVASQLEAPLLGSRHIITIHDVIPYLFKKLHRKQYYYYRYFLGRVLRRAECVITPSHHTKELLLRLYGLKEKQIQVIHNGIPQSFRRMSQPPAPVDRPYILFSGRIVPMKNIAGVLNAFTAIMHLIPHKLIITGNGGENLRRNLLPNERRSQVTIDDGRITFTGHVSSEEMTELMNGASAFVFPSFYEGFGLPPVEAMACGCPVVVSRVASLPEVCGGAAYYVDPYDVENIASGLLRVLTDESLRRKLVRRGRRRAALFSWEKSARQHLSLFSGVLGYGVDDDHETARKYTMPIRSDLRNAHAPLPLTSLSEKFVAEMGMLK